MRRKVLNRKGLEERGIATQPYELSRLACQVVTSCIAWSESALCLGCGDPPNCGNRPTRSGVGPPLVVMVLEERLEHDHRHTQQSGNDGDHGQPRASQARRPPGRISVRDEEEDGHDQGCLGRVLR